ncbi:LysR family transcriptional regulator [Huintestinicola sp.]|uniref:LysR family transcriptional regulator n=1 Tax=Huintestinicola sp. TaxID=2981661 RepID=UPI003D7E4CD6
MEFLQIKYFRIIAETENVSKAAERLFIAQPSLSQTLKRLEDELGVPLFDRNGRKITLNKAGKIFLKYCDEITVSLENARLAIEEYKGSETADVNIEVRSASLLIPDIIKKIREKDARIMPHIFQSGCNDADLQIYSDISEHSGSSELLMREPLGIVIPEAHPLARKAEIYRRDFEQCHFISLSPECSLYKIISHFCENANFRQNISTYVDSPALMRELLKMDIGAAFVPKYT